MFREKNTCSLVAKASIVSRKMLPQSNKRKRGDDGEGDFFPGSLGINHTHMPGAVYVLVIR